MAPPARFELRALCDVLGVGLGIASAWAVTRFLLYPSLGLPSHAPMILRPITGFVLAWLLLARSGESLASLGLRLPTRDRLSPWVHLLVGALLLELARRLVVRFVLPVLIEALPAGSGQAPFLLYLRGDPAHLALWLAIGWIVGAFMEEVLFRGFLMTRIARGLGGSVPAVLAGLVFQAVLFGGLHLYGGPLLAAHAAIMAVLSGVAYLAIGRNLWPLIAVHGVSNTAGLISLYRL